MNTIWHGAILPCCTKRHIATARANLCNPPRREYSRRSRVLSNQRAVPLLSIIKIESWPLEQASKGEFS